MGTEGDMFSFVNYESLFSMGKSRAEKIIALNKDFTYIKFEDQLPAGIKEKDSIENMSYVPDSSHRGLQGAKQPGKRFSIRLCRKDGRSE